VEFKAEIVAKYFLSPLRYDALEKIIERLRPEPLVAMTSEQMSEAFRTRYIPQFPIPAGLFMGGSKTPVFDRGLQLTRAGYDIIQEVASRYSTFE
jgi:hypothetical protein